MRAGRRAPSRCAPHRPAWSKRKFAKNTEIRVKIERAGTPAQPCRQQAWRRHRQAARCQTPPAPARSHQHAQQQSQREAQRPQRPTPHLQLQPELGSRRHFHTNKVVEDDGLRGVSGFVNQSAKAVAELGGAPCSRAWRTAAPLGCSCPKRSCRRAEEEGLREGKMESKT